MIDMAEGPSLPLSDDDGRQHCSVPNTAPFKAGTRRTLAWATLFACLFFALPFRVQPQGHIAWFSIDGGSGQSSSADFVLWGTLGQPDVGEQTGGDYRLVGGFWGIVLQPKPEPALRITRASSALMISWPGTAAGFQLQETLSLASPISWDAVTQTPVLVNGEYTVTVPATASATFYRLREP